MTILPQSWGAAEIVRKTILGLSETASLRLRWRAHLALAPVIARSVAAELRRERYDVLFSAYAFQSLHRLRLPYPMVTAHTSDATPTIYRESEIGRAFSNVFPGGRRLDSWIEGCERTVFRKTDLLLWPSQWLVDETTRRYGLDARQCQLVPWGANIPDPRAAPKTLLPGAPVELLLVGRDWVAKGGPVAFDTMMALADQGVDARLTVIGCEPPAAHRNARVIVHRQLDKSVPEQAELFQQCYRRAHFIVQPSFESYGFAFCEASAHAVPSLCLRIGGVPVRDGINGHALPPGSDAAAFAGIIAGYLAAPGRYAALSRSTREEYEQRLNWDAWGTRVTELLEGRVDELARTSGAGVRASLGLSACHSGH